MTTNSRAIAMLIDGDNAQPSLIEHVLAEAAKYGVVSVRRIYGNWTTPQMSGWKESLQTHAIIPVQQFQYTAGKNATDISLIIDAMDLLHAGNVYGFCIVSSDSDYTRLAMRIREHGMFAMGIGQAQTPKSFINACEVFVYTENLLPESTPAHPAIADNGGNSPEWEQMVKRAIEMVESDDGWVFLGAVGHNLRQLDPAFDPRTFGHRQLSQLVKSAPRTFETRERETNGGTSVIDVRLRATAS